jgi:hypothetical protein
VVEADRWVKKNPLVTGVNLDRALEDKDWDASIKELCHVPTLLALMSERLEETTNLGNAFLAQESEVMDVIQDLRRRAYREGNLRSNDKHKVTLKSDGTIVIQPADPQTVYVPYYNTSYVYGPWWYPAYPPWYWGPAEVVAGAGIYFWPHFYVGFSFGFGYWSYFDWPGRTIIIDVHRRPRFFRHDYDWDSHRGRWHHEPHHRRGVVYRDRITAERFGQYPKRGRVLEHRQGGFSEQRSKSRATGVRRPEQERLKRGNRDVSPAVERTPAGGRRVTSVPERRGEEAGRTEQPGRRDITTVFGGVEDGREESRSSIRGHASRGSMRQQGQEERRGTRSSSERGEKRGSGRDRGR